MGLFQTSVLKKYRKLQDKKAVEKAYKKYVDYFHNPERQQNIIEIKEEGFQQKFLMELFVNVFDYIINPDPNFNLTTEYKNEKGAKKADGAILKDGKALAVIELKSTKTKDLESIRQQAFDYKANHSVCVYIITSNFEKLRFYINNAVEFEEFNLFTLNEEQFELLYLCLHKENILQNIPLKIKTDSVVAEEKITKTFYSDYSIFKRELFRDLVKQNLKNEIFRTELQKEDTDRATKNIKQALFKKSQKLIDRFLFIFFAEDKGLLPPNSTLQILNKWKDDWDFGDERPLFDLFKQYFKFLDIGRQGTQLRAEIFAYNGGLFKSDPIIDSLILDNQTLFKHTKTLSDYDFESQVGVNILGHIFENSLNEIESVNAEIEGEEFDKQTTKRKKDGVFYTPQYITKYIVDNTIGKLCEEKKQELEIKVEEYQKSRKGRKIDTLRKFKTKLDNYRNWLLTLTIIDPACGSGAFLNQALDFLIKEHTYIDELETSLLGGGMVMKNIENTILENNIYGVDINEESVEIAKLSLWLRTAQPRRKLNTLNNNIKCGNSLIDDPNVVGNKAFNWQNEFPKIFQNGGFDVVIGNPPYVGEKGHSDIFEDLKQIPKWKEYYRRRSNTYYYFIKHGIELMKDNGLQSLIIPREFTNADWANKVRQSIIEFSQIIEIIDFNTLKIFDDAGTTSLILTQKKAIKKDYKFNFTSISNNNTIQNLLFEYKNRVLFDVASITTADYKPWDFNQFQIKYNKNIVPLSTLFDVAQGIVSGSDKVSKKHIVNGLVNENMIGRGVFILTENIDIKFEEGCSLLNINNEWVKLTDEDERLIKPYYKPENLQKWSTSKTEQYIIYVGSNTVSVNVKSYLLQFENILLNRSTITDKIISLDDFLKYSIDDIKRLYSSAGAVQKIMRKKQWFLPLYERANVPFNSTKIVVNTKNMNVFTFSEFDLYSSGGGAGGQNFIYPKTDADNDNFAFISNFTTTTNYVAFVNSLLNSSLIRHIISNGQYNQLSTSKISDLPIILIDFTNKNEKNIYESIILMISVLREKNELMNKSISQFGKYLSKIFGLSGHLKNWNKLDFSDFIKELNKAKKASGENLSKKEEMEWMELFEEKNTEVQTFKAEIEKTNIEINQMVYKLYGLTEKEINVIENE